MIGLSFKDIYRMYYRDIYKYVYELADGNVELADRLFRKTIEKAYITFDPKKKIDDYGDWLRSIADKKAKKVLKNRGIPEKNSWEYSFYDNMNSDKFLIFISRKKRREPGSLVLISIILILILSSVVGVLTTNGTAEAMVNGIQDKYYDFTGEEHMRSDKMYDHEFTKIDKKTKNVTKDLLPDAFFPKEPFKGYEFSGGVLSKFDKNNVTLMLTYEKGESFIHIEYTIFNENAKIGLDPDTKKGYKGGILYMGTIEDDLYDINTVSYMRDNEFLSITGTESMDALEKYMKNHMIPHIE